MRLCRSQSRYRIIDWSSPTNHLETRFITAPGRTRLTHGGRVMSTLRGGQTQNEMNLTKCSPRLACHFLCNGLTERSEGVYTREASKALRMDARGLKRRAVFTAGRHQAYPRQGPGYGVGRTRAGLWGRAH